MYFEARSTIKHRAHKEAYRIACEELMKRVGEGEREERELLKKVEEEYIVRRLQGREESEFVGPICVMMIMMMMA